MLTLFVLLYTASLLAAVMSEMESPGPRNSGSGDIGYGFVNLERPGLEQVENGLRNGRSGTSHGPGTEGTGTWVCGHVIKEE